MFWARSVDTDCVCVIRVSIPSSRSESILESDTTRFGVRTRPWERTQVKSSINTQATEFGPRTFANFGLTQGFKWKENWAFDVGVDIFGVSNWLRTLKSVPPYWESFRQALALCTSTSTGACSWSACTRRSSAAATA